MTKYILNSGGISNNPELGKKFFAEVMEELKHYGDTRLPIHALKKGEYVIFEQ